MAIPRARDSGGGGVIVQTAAMPTAIETEKMAALLAEGVAVVDVLPKSTYDEEHIPGLGTSR